MQAQTLANHLISPQIKSNVSLLCYYINPTTTLQNLRIQGSLVGEFARLVFPGQRLMFSASADDRLEVYQAENGEEVLIEVIDCCRLKVVD